MAAAPNTRADRFARDRASRSKLIQPTVVDTAVNVLAFMVLLGFLVAMTALAFSWQWLPRVFLALLVASAVLLLRSRLLGKRPAYYEEPVHLTTITVGVMSAVVLKLGMFS